MRLGLLGAGSIGGTVAKAVASGQLPGVEVVAVAGASTPPSERVERIAALVGAEALDVGGMIQKRPDWVLEAAGNQATKTYLVPLLDAGSGVIVMSIGALLDETLHQEIRERQRRGGRLITPSGAIGGLDAVAALNARGGLTSARITTTKAPSGLEGAPYLLEHGIELPNNRSLTVFEGTAREAVQGFPANVNVAAALSLAGHGADKTVVRIISDPATPRTRHAIEASGEAGVVRVEIEANPNPENPRSSYLAALSAVATVRSLVS
ncbi:MAG: aspartate dehydrogenase [Trueperaceae bacterium]|nr:MAG: aspartate dehydrogenase [Trueperaceae bacterium]